MKRKSKPTHFKSLLIFFFLLAILLWILWANTALELNQYTITVKNLPESFTGFRIAHVSDLHNAQIGKNNTKLLQILKNAKPNMIAITGDMIDSRKTDIDVALYFAEEAVKIAPCYYVTGNHEARIADYPEFKEKLMKLGVVVLDNQATQLEFSGNTITLLGVNDPSFQTSYLTGDSASVMRESLQEIHPKDDSFTLLLSHRPELFDVYKEFKIDLVLSGHAHGGQFRIPFLGGLLAPNQGWFPKYDAGLFTEGSTNMLVSRGIGNSAFPFRLNNRPEILLVELQA